MWIAFLVVMLANNEVMVQAAPEPFTSEEACVQMNKEVEKAIRNEPRIKSFALKCVEVTADERKRNGKDS